MRLFINLTMLFNKYKVLMKGKKLRRMRFKVTALSILIILCMFYSAQAQQPDLIITNLAVNRQCQLVVTLQNQGNGPLPDSTNQPGGGPALQLYKGGQPFEGRTLYGSSLGGLKNRGGTLSWTSPGDKITGFVSIGATIDALNIIRESNESNNSLTKTLTCNPPLPDLAITNIRFTPDCRTQVHIQNIGDAPAPDNIYNLMSGVYLIRTVNGVDKGWMRLSAVDPRKQTQPTGGSHTWVDSPDFKATRTIKFTISGGWQEKSTINNQKQVDVPAECSANLDAYSAKPDLVITNLAVNRQCQLVVTLQNQGNGPLPDSTNQPGGGPALQLSKGSQRLGGWVLYGSSLGDLRNPGGTLSWTYPTDRIIGFVSIGATIDALNIIRESNESNNSLTKRLTCRL